MSQLGGTNTGQHVATTPKTWVEKSFPTGIGPSVYPLPVGWRFYVMFLLQPYRMAGRFREAVKRTETKWWSLATLRAGPLRPRGYEMKVLRSLFWHLLPLAVLPLCALIVVLRVRLPGAAPVPLLLSAAVGTFLLFAVLGWGARTSLLFVPLAVIGFAAQWIAFRDAQWRGWGRGAAFIPWVAFTGAGVIAASKLGAFRAVELGLAAAAGVTPLALRGESPALLVPICLVCFVLGMLAGSANMVRLHNAYGRGPRAWGRVWSVFLMFLLTTLLVHMLEFGPHLNLWVRWAFEPPPSPEVSFAGLSLMLGTSRLLETVAVNVVQLVLYVLNRWFGLPTLRFSPILCHDAHGRTYILSRHLCLAPEGDPVFARVLQACYLSPGERFIGMLTQRRVAPDVFLSYNSKDGQLVGRLACELGDAGVSVWLDKTALKFGERDWESRLHDGLMHTSVVVVCVGPAGLGQWQQQEYEITRSLRRKTGYLPMIVLLLPGAAELPEVSEHPERLDLSGSDASSPDLFGDAVRRIAATAAEHKPKAADELKRRAKAVVPAGGMGGPPPPSGVDQTASAGGGDVIAADPPVGAGANEPDAEEPDLDTNDDASYSPAAGTRVVGWPLIEPLLESEAVGVLRAWWGLFLFLIVVPPIIGYVIDGCSGLSPWFALIGLGLGLSVTVVMWFFADLPTKSDCDFVEDLQAQSLIRATGSKTLEEAQEKVKRLRQLEEEQDRR